MASNFEKNQGCGGGLEKKFNLFNKQTWVPQKN